MVLFIDCQVAGISGDMILSSLVDLGADKSKIIDGIKESANLLQDSTIKKLDFIKVQKKGKSATQLVLEKLMKMYMNEKEVKSKIVFNPLLKNLDYQTLQKNLQKIQLIHSLMQNLMFTENLNLLCIFMRRLVLIQ